MNGYLRVGQSIPEIEVGNIFTNTEKTLTEINYLYQNGCKIIVFPELSLTSNNLSYLFRDKNILDNSLNAIFKILRFTENMDIFIFVTIPYEYKHKIYEACFVLKSGKIVAIVPRKTIESKVIDNNIFSNANNIKDELLITNQLNNSIYKVPFSSDIIFNIINFKNLTLSISFDDDLINCHNTDIVINPSSQFETVYVNDRFNLIKMISENKNNAIISSSPSYTESTTKYAYYSRAYTVEDGVLLNRNDNLFRTNIITDIDIDLITSIKNNNISNNVINIDVSFDNNKTYMPSDKLYRNFDRTPYIPKNIDKFFLSNHIIEILAIALMKRMKTIKTEDIILGLSGGLDSTMALFVANKTLELMQLDKSHLHLITMPGFGTSNNTLNDVNDLARLFGVRLNTIDIKESINQHFRDINHNSQDVNVTFENAQARERTQVLMDLANDLNGIVIGTSDLSEIALGFSTYNGDQMSMFNVNSSLPKTLIKFIFNSLCENWDKNNINNELSNLLKNIIIKPISPELKPSINGETNQFSESILGDYILHDYYIYYYLKYNLSIEKIYDLSLRAFVYCDDHLYDEIYVKNAINVFFDRFYKAQYKRNASPDGISIGIPNLNSINFYNIPSDNSLCKTII